MNFNTSIRTESLNTVVAVAHDIVNDVIHIEGVPFNEYFATRELNAELVRGLEALTKRLQKMGPAAMNRVEFNVAEKFYPQLDAIYNGKC
jgi:hypothetical protein